MCGIMGYVGKKNAAPIIYEGLKKLEYRGYDSAGVALLQDGFYTAIKCSGRVEELKKRGALNLSGKIGIGHTRWATHGAPTPENAHPHFYGKFAIVHNGIIENYAELMHECLERGEKFSSSTDSEVIAHLLAFYDCGNFLETVKKTVRRLRGSYALAILCSDFPNEIAVCREKSPLVLGVSEDGVRIASDLPAIASESKTVYVLRDGEFALVGQKKVSFYDQEREIQKEGMTESFASQNFSRGKYEHYMWKEIEEIPTAIDQTLRNFKVNFCFSGLCEVLCQTEYIEIVACGTAYHSGIAAKYVFEKLARVKTNVSVASEFRYADPIISPHTLVIAVSQSGETADTLAAAELAKQRGAYVLAVTNVAHSSLTSIADRVLQTYAGTEIGVAATKSFNAQLSLLFSLALELAKAKGMSPNLTLDGFSLLSRQVILSLNKIQEYAEEISKANHVLFIGRGVDYCCALEGSLKLKEISYLPSEGYPAGELKHGTLALIDEKTPVIAILTRRELAEKTMNALCEVSARGGKIYLFTTLPEYAEREEIYRSFLLPSCEELFSPLLAVIPLQALAYFTALKRGNDPDKPRHLAKSVTVE